MSWVVSTPNHAPLITSRFTKVFVRKMPGMVEISFSIKSESSSLQGKVD